jgi:flagellar protein FliS
VHLLYRGALDSVVSARRYLRVGDIPARSRAITKAMLIVTELSRSLNMQAGGEMSRNLAELYDYILKLLIQANTEQREAPLSEADRLLSTLLEAWSACLPAEPMPSDDQPGALYGAEYEAEPLAVSY